MFEELSKHINKPVALLLKNGKEKKGRIVFLDSDDQTIAFEDGSTVAISFVKNLTTEQSTIQAQPVAQTQPIAVQTQPVVVPTVVKEEPVVVKEEPKPQPVEVVEKTEMEAEPIKFEPEPVPVVHQTPAEVVAKAKVIQQSYNTQIEDVLLTLNAPELAGMPNEIKDIDGIGKSEEAKMWTNIMNQYNDGVRHGKFLTDADKVEKMLVHVKHLSHSPFLFTFVTIPQLLAYLTYMQGEKKEALEHIKHAIRLQDSPDNAISLATIALDLGENELAFFTLKKLFLKINFTQEQYKMIWFKFLDLVIKIKAYNDFSMIFSNKYRQLSSEEKRGVYEAVIFFLLRNRQRKDAHDLIESVMEAGEDSDVRYLALDMLKKWGLPEREYEIDSKDKNYQEFQTDSKHFQYREKITLPDSTRNKRFLDTSKPTSQYTFSSIILTLRENYGFIKYGTNNLFFHAFDLSNCQFAELSESDQVEFKLKKGIKGTDVACEVRLMHPPKKIIEPKPEAVFAYPPQEMSLEEEPNLDEAQV